MKISYIFNQSNLHVSQNGPDTDTDTLSEYKLVLMVDLGERWQGSKCTETSL